VASNAFCSGTGKERGHLPQARIDYAFTKNISAYVLAEYLIPGNFYKDKDTALFLRTELQIKF
jgi:predicted porin